MEDRAKEKGRLAWLFENPWDPLQVVAAIVVAFVVGGGTTVVIVGGGNSKQSGPSTAPPPHSAFLSELNPEGDRPQTGNPEYRGRELANSIFYENITTAQSTASPCEDAPEAYCRATNYQLGGRNNVFTCKFAVEAHSTYNNGTHWRVSVDGHVLKEGAFQPNSAAEPLSVRLEGGETLELRVTTDEPGLSEPKVIWGDATIR
jgi:hypothetical protein